MYRIEFCKRSFVFLLILVAELFFAQQNGKVVESINFESNILGGNIHYSVYLPPDYELSQRNYPVVYLLHGFGDDDQGWILYGEINRFLDQGIQSGNLPPMIVIMPDAQKTWYNNSTDGKTKYEDFFVKEFIPKVEKKYRIKSEKRYRGIAGLSMGGYGTLLFALKNPELFIAAAPLSAAVFTDDELVKMSQEQYVNYFGKVYNVQLPAEKRLDLHWKNNSILELVKNTSEEKLKSVNYYLDCGDDDFLIKGNTMLNLMLIDKKVPHEFRIRNGAHNWTYWRTGITDAMVFIGDYFRQK